MGEVIYWAPRRFLTSEEVRERFERRREAIGLSEPTAPDTAPAEYVAPPDDCA